MSDGDMSAGIKKNLTVGQLFDLITNDGDLCIPREWSIVIGDGVQAERVVINNAFQAIELA